MNTNSINDLFEKWIDFREEELSVLTKEDKKYLIYFDEHLEKILNKVSESDKKYVNNQLNELDIEFTNYTTYWTRKYYKSGFKDCLYLLLSLIK